MAKETHLTDREKEILRLIADEYSSSEIADTLEISIRTVETHRKHIIRKLEAKGPVSLVKEAIKHGMLDGYHYRS